MINERTPAIANLVVQTMDDGSMDTSCLAAPDCLDEEGAGGAQVRDDRQGTSRVATRLAVLGIFHFRLLLPEVLSTVWPHS